MKLDRYIKITSKFHKKKIMVIGDLMLDQYFWGYTERISPEAPVPIVDIDKHKQIDNFQGDILLIN